MTIYSRDNNAITFLTESGTYAVASGTSGCWFGLVQNHSPTESENVTEIRYAGTSSRNIGQFVSLAKDYNGTITYYAQNLQMYAYALGSCVDTSGTTSVHVISELNSNAGWAYTSGTTQLTNFPSFTIVDSKKGLVDGGHMVRKYNGCVVDKLQLKADNGKIVEMQLTYKGQVLNPVGSKSTDIINILNADSTRPYVWSDVTFQVPNGTNMNEVNTLTYTIENNVAPRHFVNGSRVAQALVPTMRNHTIELNLTANSTWAPTLENYYQNGSVFNATLTLLQTATHQGIFTFSGCEIQKFSAPSESQGIDEFMVTIRPQTVSFIGSDTLLKYNPL